MCQEWPPSCNQMSVQIERLVGWGWLASCKNTYLEWWDQSRVQGKRQVARDLDLDMLKRWYPFHYVYGCSQTTLLYQIKLSAPFNKICLAYISILIFIETLRYVFCLQIFVYPYEWNIILLTSKFCGFSYQYHINNIKIIMVSTQMNMTLRN